MMFMKKIIVYGSHYGTTKRYAEKMSELTGLPAMSYEKVKSLSEYDEVIHFGGLYAGGVKGLKSTVKLLPQTAKLIIVTVGLADVSKKENTDHIKKAIGMQVSQDILDRSLILHLRGGIDYSRLGFLHKGMMALVHKKLKSIPDEQKTAEDWDMLETYGKKVDFTDFDSLQQVIDAM